MARQLYTADTTEADYYPGDPGWYSNRRAYDYENYFGSRPVKDLSRVFTLLATEGTFQLETQGTDNGNDRKVINFPHMMKTSDNNSNSYAQFYWKTQNEYYNTVGLGPFFATHSDIKAFWHPNVIGATFSWRKDQGYWTAGECGFNNWGLVYYSPSRDQWRTVRFNEGTLNGNVRTSPEGDKWTFYNGDPTEYGTEVSGWQGNRGILSSSNQTKVMNNDWLWGGLYFTGGTTTRGGASRERKLDISDFQPIYGNKGSFAKLVLPFESQDINELSELRSFR